MNQNNSREVEEKAERTAREFCKNTPRIKKESGVEFYERLNATIFNLLTTHHQELQKAREEERERALKAVSGWMDDAQWHEIKDRVFGSLQSELDQPTEEENWHMTIEMHERMDMEMMEQDNLTSDNK